MLCFSTLKEQQYVLSLSNFFYVKGNKTRKNKSKVFTRVCGSVYAGQFLMREWKKVLCKRCPTRSAGHTDAPMPTCNNIKKELPTALYQPSVSGFNTDFALQSKCLPPAEKRSPRGGI